MGVRYSKWNKPIGHYKNSSYRINDSHREALKNKKKPNILQNAIKAQLYVGKENGLNSCEMDILIRGYNLVFFSKDWLVNTGMYSKATIRNSLYSLIKKGYVWNYFGKIYDEVVIHNEQYNYNETIAKHQKHRYAIKKNAVKLVEEYFKMCEWDATFPSFEQRKYSYYKKPEGRL